MKKLALSFLMLFLLTGCAQKTPELQKAMELRESLLNGEGCSFLCEITADYGDSVHKFSADCQGDAQGNVTFTVTAPETISGIRGQISDRGGEILFDETALHFGLLTDRQLSPVSGPWIFLKTLRGGYLMNGGKEEDLIHIGARDSYEEDALLVDLWLGPGEMPQRSEILFRGRKILTLEIQDFQIHAGE